MDPSDILLPYFAPNYGTLNFVETTIDLPESILRDAEATAAAEGKSLPEFVAEAVSDRLRRTHPVSQSVHTWELAFGGLSDLHDENQRIARVIEVEFESLDDEQWR